jgi:hypothetical protein
MSLGNPCPICKRYGSLTFEDVLPTWQRKVALAMSLPDVSNQAPARLKLRICRDCNGRLGRVFEHSVAPLMTPMIKGESIILSKRSQTLISAWAVKTHILLLYALQERNNPVLREPMIAMIRKLLDQPLPPVQSSVRLCRTSLKAQNPADFSRLSDLVPENRPLVGSYEVSWIGTLGIETLIGHQATLLPFIADCDGMAKRFVRIWPPQVGQITWPCTEIVTQGELLALRAAWAERTPSWEPPPVDHTWNLLPKQA